MIIAKCEYEQGYICAKDTFTANYQLLPLLASFVSKLATHWQHRLGISMGCQHNDVWPKVLLLPFNWNLKRLKGNQG